MNTKTRLQTAGILTALVAFWMVVFRLVGIV